MPNHRLAEEEYVPGLTNVYNPNYVPRHAAPDTDLEWWEVPSAHQEREQRTAAIRGKIATLADLADPFSLNLGHLRRSTQW